MAQNIWIICLILVPFMALCHGYQIPPAVNCAKQAEGVVGLLQPGKCTSSFTKCAYGKPYPQQCPRGLFYNLATNQCDYKHRIAACGGVPPPPPLDCSGRPDGLYAEQDCASAVFYTCHAGVTNRQACAAGTVFEQKSSRCQFTNQCAKSNAPSPPAPAPPAPGPPPAYPQMSMRADDEDVESGVIVGDPPATSDDDETAGAEENAADDEGSTTSTTEKPSGNEESDGEEVENDGGGEQPEEEGVQLDGGAQNDAVEDAAPPAQNGGEQQENDAEGTDVEGIDVEGTNETAKIPAGENGGNGGGEEEVIEYDAPKGCPPIFGGSFNSMKVQSNTKNRVICKWIIIASGPKNCPKFFQQCDSNPPKCQSRPNQIWWQCTNICEPSCGNPKPNCRNSCGQSGCQCFPGFYRNQQGKCVPKDDCDDE